MKNFSIRLEKEEREGIERIAKANGIKPSVVLRKAARHYIKSMARRKGGLSRV